MHSSNSQLSTCFRGEFFTKVSRNPTAPLQLKMVEVQKFDITPQNCTLQRSSMQVCLPVFSPTCLIKVRNIQSTLFSTISMIIWTAIVNVIRMIDQPVFCPTFFLKVRNLKPTYSLQWIICTALSSLVDWPVIHPTSLLSRPHPQGRKALVAFARIFGFCV